MRKKSKKIRSLIGDYNSYKNIRKHLASENDEGNFFKEYRSFELKALRELAAIKKDSPNTFRLACFYDKLILN